MKILNWVMITILLGAAPGAVTADNGAVHVCINGDCEKVEDDPCPEEDCYEWQATYYQNRIFYDPEVDRDIPGWLDYETEWPSQRDEFSDFLMR